MSAQWVNHAGCPASEGVPGMVAFPSGPWQPAHGEAFFRPASTSAAGAWVVAARMMAEATQAPASDRSGLSACR
jgi:hypothetical protein